MNTNLVYLRPIKLACVRATGPYAQSSAKAWDQLFAWLGSKGLHAFPGCGYGLMLDNHLVTEASAYRYDACIEISETLENRVEGNLQIRKLPAGAYLRQRHTGSYEELREKALDVRRAWVSDKTLILDPKRPLVQIFLDDPRRVGQSELRGDLCVPVITHAPA